MIPTVCEKVDPWEDGTPFPACDRCEHSTVDDYLDNPGDELRSMYRVDGVMVCEECLSETLAERNRQ